MINLSEINGINYKAVLRLKVSEDQKSYVASNSAILAKAYAYRMEGGTALGIFKDGIEYVYYTHLTLPTNTIE